MAKAEEIHCHRYPTRGKHCRHTTQSCLSVLRVEDNANDQVCVPSKRSKHERHSFDLPRDFIFSVLLLLPFEVLHKVIRLVCKEWSDIVSGLQFRRQYRQMSGGGFLFQTTLERGKIFCIEDKTTRLKMTGIELPSCRLLGSYNGLSLVYDFTQLNRFHLVNLVTKVKFTLPHLAGFCKVNGSTTLAHGSSGVCKVVFVAGRSCCEKAEMRVLTVGVDEAWRVIDLQDIRMKSQALVAILTGPSHLTAGFIYWCSSDCNIGLALNVDTETVHTFSYPEDFDLLDGIPNWFLSMDKGLGLMSFDGHTSRMWELKDLETSEWTEVAAISIRALLDWVAEQLSAMERCSFSPVRFINGDLWFMCRVDMKHYVVCYRQANESIDLLPIMVPSTDLFPHAHTLLSPKNYNSF